MQRHHHRDTQECASDGKGGKHPSRRGMRAHEPSADSGQAKRSACGSAQVLSGPFRTGNAIVDIRLILESIRQLMREATLGLKIIFEKINNWTHTFYHFSWCKAANEAAVILFQNTKKCSESLLTSFTLVPGNRLAIETKNCQSSPCDSRFEIGKVRTGCMLKKTFKKNVTLRMTIISPLRDSNPDHIHRKNAC